MKTSKKIFIGIAVLLIIVIIVVAIVIFGKVKSAKFVKETKSKLSQIDAKEFETELINELKKTSLNVNTSEIETTFEIASTKEISDDTDVTNGTSNIRGNIEDELNEVLEREKNEALKLEKKMRVTELKAQGLMYAHDEEYFDGFVFANLDTETTNRNGFQHGKIEFPCFKIVSDENGKIESIQYAADDQFNISIDIIEKTIAKVLKEKYDIDEFMELVNKCKEEEDSNIGSFKKIKFYSSGENELLAKLISNVTGVENNEDLEEKLQKDNASELKILKIETEK